MPPTRIPLIYGAADIGAVGKAKVTDLSVAQALIDVFVNAGHVGVDTSRQYSTGTSEEYLAKLDLKGARIDTKVFPTQPGNHSAARLPELFQQSLTALQGNKIRVFYLHAPDRSVPFEETLKTVDELYRAGHFEQFGLSNYMAWEVAEIVGICKANGYVLPTVYEGVYSILERGVEQELIPCLRKFGIKFAAYSPLAGGVLVGIYLNKGFEDAEPGSRFDPAGQYAAFFRRRYEPAIIPTRELNDVVVKHGFTLLEVSIRWLQHHSILTPDDHGIIYGGSKPEQLAKTLKINEEGPLPDEVIQAVNEMSAKVKGNTACYFL
ncbi:aflatoxin B1-aldehyde reductase [Hysterangium stoloniferum]|nr:aflatoxin B1-aldehyde reductase [Hysterangium stoloniferum]